MEQNNKIPACHHRFEMRNFSSYSVTGIIMLQIFKIYLAQIEMHEFGFKLQVSTCIKY